MAALMHFYPAMTLDAVYELTPLQVAIFMSKIPILQGASEDTDGRG